METAVSMQEPFSYAAWPMVLLGILLVGCAIYLLVATLVGRKKPQPEIKVMQPTVRNTEKIKRDALGKLEQLQGLLYYKQISNREAYQQMSLCVRQFVFEMTGIRVQNCTLADIKALRMPALEQLMAEYYSPEFAAISQGNGMQSIEKTKKVIEQWK